MSAVGGLVGDLHLVEILPVEGGDRFGVVLQVCDVSLRWGFGHIENKLCLWSLIVLGVERGRGHGGEDELVHLQDEHGHERGMGRLVLQGAPDQDWDPNTLSLVRRDTDHKGIVLLLTLITMLWSSNAFLNDFYGFCFSWISHSLCMVRGYQWL